MFPCFSDQGEKEFVAGWLPEPIPGSGEGHAKIQKFPQGGLR